MPSNAGPDSPNSLSHNWCSNAEEQAINPLCSPGNKSAFDYLVERIDDRKITQDRARGLYIQVALCMLGIAIFARNFHVSVQLTYERPRALASWCCLVQTTAGCVWGALYISHLFPGGVTCNQAILAVMIGICISSMCVLTILLHKVYVAYDCNRWIRRFGFFILIIPPSVVYMAFNEPATFQPNIGCVGNVPKYYSWLRFGMEALLNVIFSAAFLNVVYRQYRKFGSAAWRYLVREGIINLSLMLSTNVFCMFMAAFITDVPISAIFYPIDWTIISLLLVAHIKNMRMSAKYSKTPHTTYVMKDFSKIEARVSSIITHS